ncbi:two-component system histidine kinase PnpS [Thermodesulfobacteriota bacterium]
MNEKRRLIWTLYPSYLLIIIVSLTAVTWFASYSARKFFLKQVESDLETRALLFKSQIRNYLDPVDQEYIDRLCKKEGSLSSTRITLILPSGRVLGDSEGDPLKMDNHADRPEFLGAIENGKGLSTRYSLTLQKNFMYLGTSVYTGNQLKAVVRTSIPVDIIDREIDKIQRKNIYGGFIIALFAAAVCLIVSRRISRPIEELRVSAQGIARGDFRLKRPVTGIAEIKNLYDSMKEMAEELDRRIKTITRQRNEIETILSSMDEGVLAIDSRERIISINNAAAEMLGTNKEDCQGRSVQETIRNSAFHDFVQNALSGQGPVEREVELFNDEEKFVNVNGTALRDPDGRKMGALIVLKDISRIKKLENIRRDFVANVSHEIKTPITAIKGFVETLRHGEVSSENDRERFLGIISNHVNRLEAIINDLLKLSRIEKETETDDIDFSHENIIDVLETAVQICRPGAMEKAIEISLDCDEKLKARINSPLLEQAVMNLLDNAIKYSENNKNVHVRSFLKEDDLVIEVADEGKGIGEEHLPRLFERFYRVDKARSRKLGGTGLGLAIVKHITQAHGGKVTVESTPDKGSVFTITLPANN